MPETSVPLNFDTVDAERSGQLSQDADNATDWAVAVQFPARAMMGFFSLHHRVQTGSGVHPASYPMELFSRG
jgi:hypothetical protein